MHLRQGGSSNPDARRLRPPVVCRALIRAASWIVPRRERSEWWARWDSGLRDWWVLVERGEMAGDAKQQMVRHSWSAFSDALWRRCSREELRHWLRGPSFVLVAAAIILLATAALSGGFSAARALWQPLPMKDTGSLVSLRYTGAANDPSGVPARLVPVWRNQSKLLADLAGYRYRHWGPRASVTTNFFVLLGTPATVGRTFAPGDTDVAVLSARAWRTTFGADPRVIGSTIPVDGRARTVIGVLPETFWAISPSIAIWTPLILEPQPTGDVPFLIGAIGRLKRGASEVALRKELVEIAATRGYRLPRPPQVTSFYALPDRTIFTYLFGVLFALLVGVVLVAISRPSLRGYGWRYWSFFGLKTAAIVAILPLLWIEIGAAARSLLPDTMLRPLLAGLVFTIVFVVGFSWAVWWSFADQRRRCPVCLHRLTMPVTIGSWASVLEPVTTEMLCEEGHGSMCVPETESGEPDRWTALDASWRELFKK